MNWRMATALMLCAAGVLGLWLTRDIVPATTRQEVVFWHFWGGEDGRVVEDIVRSFNEQQDQYVVRAVAMPGNNLDVKLFLSITGGDPPDLVNQDSPIVADWGARGALTPLDEIAGDEEIEQLRGWLFPAARKLGEYEGRMYALCNGLDIRTLYYNRSMLDQYNLSPPTSLAELDGIASTIAPPAASVSTSCYGFLPDSRRIWAWGIVFGGQFYDESTSTVTANDPRIVDALTWMTGYSQRYGKAAVAAFRVGDQSLPGKTFPLVAGRYAVVMDGQWRVRDIAAAQRLQRASGEPVTEYGVCPLPPPPGGRHRAGWVNGNFFVVPTGARCPSGAWEFMKFWSGFGGNESNAAQACVAGGWIPPSQHVVDQPLFQEYLTEQPLFAQFVELAGSPHQIPTPMVPGAPMFYDEITSVAATSMYRNQSSPAELLNQATAKIQQKLEESRGPQPGP